MTTTTPTLGEVFSGFQTLQTAISNGDLVLQGSRHLVRAFPRWFLWSSFAIDTLERQARPTF